MKFSWRDACMVISYRFPLSLITTQKKQVWGKLTFDLKYQISSKSCEKQKNRFLHKLCENVLMYIQGSSKWAHIVACLWNLTQFPSKLLWDGVTSPVSPPPKASVRKHTPTHSRAAACMLIQRVPHRQRMYCETWLMFSDSSFGLSQQKPAVCFLLFHPPLQHKPPTCNSICPLLLRGAGERDASMRLLAKCVCCSFIKENIPWVWGIAYYSLLKYLKL